MDFCDSRNKNPIFSVGQESSSESGGGGTFIEHSIDFVCTSAPCSCRDHNKMIKGNFEGDKNLTKSFENEDMLKLNSSQKHEPWGWLVPSHPTSLKTPVW